MQKIAFMIGDRFIYWSPIIVTFGVLAAVCMFLALYMGNTGKVTGAFVAVPLAIVLSLVMGRLVYWCCEPESYDSLLQAVTEFSTEGIALTGIAAGCILAAGLVRLVGLCKNLPAMLDAMSLAGLFGLAVGRLNHFFNDGDRALDRVFLDGTLKEIWPPLFLLQAAASAVLFLIFVVFFLIVGRKRPGDTCLLVGFFYGAVQVVLDSTRYDALHLPGIPVLTLVQMIGLGMALLSTILFCVKLVKNRGWKWWYLTLFVPAAGALCYAGVMAHQIRCYPGNDMEMHYVTAAVFAAAAVFMLAIYILATTGKKKVD